MWPGCIYAAVQEMKTIELALLREPCFCTGHRVGNDSVAVCHCGWWSKTANTTEAAGLDYLHEGFSTSRPNILCAGQYSVLT